MKYFLMVYDRALASITECTDFAEADRVTALRERARLTKLYIARPEIEVVLLGASSFADLEKTHSRYFKTTEDLALAAQQR